MHQLANQVFDVPADVASLAELGRVGFYKRHFDKLGNVLDEIRFSDTGRPDQDYVLLDVFGFFRAPRVFFLQRAQILCVVVMVANRNRKDFLRFFLLDHESVQMRFDVPRKKIELEFPTLDLLRFFFVSGNGGLRFRKSRDCNPLAEVLFHELRDLGFQFFR